MKYSAALTILTMAGAALAAPAELSSRGHHGGGGDDGGDGSVDICSNDQKQVCCTGLLTCAVQVLGSGCSGSSYCCNTNEPVGALINISLLNCLSIL